jgi:uncharacterized membrane protein YqhA
MKIVEKIFEMILWYSRLMVILPVIACVIAALVLIMAGTLEIYEAAHGFISINLSDEASMKFLQTTLITYIVGAIDYYLIATVLLIFGIGLYELFISKVDMIERDDQSGNILIVHNLDQLKTKLAKVILMILIVTFFKYSIKFAYEEILSLLYLAIGTFLISLSIYFSGKKE